jgi:hypothetical protein
MPCPSDRVPSCTAAWCEDHMKHKNTEQHQQNTVVSSCPRAAYLRYMERASAAHLGIDRVLLYPSSLFSEPT